MEDQADIQMEWQTPPQRNVGEGSRAGYPMLSTAILMDMSLCVCVGVCVHTYNICRIYIYDAVICDTKNSVLMAK